MSDIPNTPKRLQWTPDLVSAFWNGVSHTRLVELSFGRAAAPSLVSAVWGHLRQDGTHLDLGAGDGDLVAELLAAGLRVAAFEPSRERRKVLESRFQDQTGFIGCVDHSTETQFDVVFLCEVIEHVLEEDFEAFLTNLGRLVRDGGTLIVTTPNTEDLDLSSAFCPLCGHLFHRWQHQRSMTAASLEAAMQRAGFESLVTHRIEFRSDYFKPFQNVLRGRHKLPSRIFFPVDGNRLGLADRLRRGWERLAIRLRRATRIIVSGQDDAYWVPDYVYHLIENRPTQIGAGTQLLSIGRIKKHAATPCAGT